MQSDLKSEQNFAAILFDLDGTLLQVEMADFIPRYIMGLASHCRDQVAPERFRQVLLQAIRLLISGSGDGQMTNKDRLFSQLVEELSVPEVLLHECFNQFAEDGLDRLQELIQPIPLARRLIEECLSRGLPVVLATNPVFPEFMIQARLAWAGLADLPFEHLTSYENSCFCKPQPGYFLDIAARLQVAPEKCLMIGNDTNHDLAAAAVGMTTFLVDTWIVEREGKTWPCHHRGDHAVLHQFLRDSL